MDIRKIKKLIELVEESGINELEISEGEESVRINRGGSVIQAPMMQAAPAMAPVAQAPAAAPAPTPAADVAPAAFLGAICQILPRMNLMGCGGSNRLWELFATTRTLAWPRLVKCRSGRHKVCFLFGDSFTPCGCSAAHLERSSS